MVSFDYKFISATIGIIIFVSLCGPNKILANHDININTASAATLETLSGIGASKAAAIVDYREQHGDFASIEDIKNVSGIGDSTFAGIKDHITVGSVVTNDPDDKDDTNESSQTAENSSSSEEVTGVSASSGSRSRPEPVAGLVIEAPAVAYTNQPLTFDVEPLAGTDGRLIRYRWSFGDGYTSDTKSPSHRYRHPGRYVIVVASRYQKQDREARQEILVLPVELKVTESNGFIKITNQSEEEINLGGMEVVGSATLTLPDPTILLAGATLTIGGERLKAGDRLVVRDQSGQVVAVSSNASAPSSSFAPSPANQPETTKSATVPEAASVSTTSVSTNNQQMAAVAAAAPPNNDRWPYLGLVGVLLLAFLSLFWGRSHPQAESPLSR